MVGVCELGGGSVHLVKEVFSSMDHLKNNSPHQAVRLPQLFQLLKCLSAFEIPCERDILLKVAESYKRANFLYARGRVPSLDGLDFGRVHPDPLGAND